MKNCLINTATMLVSAVITILTLELLTAVFFPQSVLMTSVPGDPFIRYDEYLGWANRENTEGVYRLSGYTDEITIKINKHGMRGAETGEKKIKYLKRLIILGDSNTFGYGIGKERRFSDILSKMLGDGYEVLNLGVLGYGTDQEYLSLEKRGLRFEPDVVVLAFSAGDLSDNMNSINSGSSKPYFKIEGDEMVLKNTPVPERAIFRRHGSVDSRLKNILYSNSHLYRLIFHRLIASSRLMHDSVREMNREEGMRVTVNLLKMTNKLCKKNDCRLLVLLIPHETFVKAGVKTGSHDVGYFPLLKTLLSSIGIEFTDSSAALIGRAREGERVFIENDPVHLNVRGNEIVAGILYAALIKKGFIKGDREVPISNRH